MPELLKNKPKLSLIALILMIFTTIYGFGNVSIAFLKMGYSAIPWYILGGLFFFLPFALMVTELGSSFKSEKGGIYSWMSKSVNPTYAFMATFMWYSAYVVWMMMISNNILVPLTNLIFGETNLPSTFIISIFAICWIIVVTVLSLGGLKQIKIFTTIGGISVLSINGIVLICALIIFFKNGMHPATPITFDAFTSSPNPHFQPSAIAFVAFMIYALFAYGGAEAVGGLVDETKDPERNFHRGVIFAAVVITIGYSIMILMVGLSINYDQDWLQAVQAGSIHVGNASYAMMNSLGNNLGVALGLSPETSLFLGKMFARVMALSLLLSLIGAFFTLLYAPLKQLIEGTPKELWPARLAELKDGLPKRAMLVQCSIVIILILLNLLASLANQGLADVFFQTIVNLANISMTLPYLFIIIAYYFFKKNQSIPKPFVILKSKSLVLFVIVVGAGLIVFANLFTIIQPIFDYLHQEFNNLAVQQAAFSKMIRDVLSMILGPILFCSIAYCLIRRYNKNHRDQM